MVGIRDNAVRPEQTNTHTSCVSLALLAIDLIVQKDLLCHQLIVYNTSRKEQATFDLWVRRIMHHHQSTRPSVF
eukprot:scaffold26592_cov127-Cylindrotheca_fusiformis.AAC.2